MKRFTIGAACGFVVGFFLAAYAAVVEAIRFYNSTKAEPYEYEADDPA